MGWRRELIVCLCASSDKVGQASFIYRRVIAVTFTTDREERETQRDTWQWQP